MSSMEHLKTFTNVIYGTTQNVYKCRRSHRLWNISNLLHMSSMEDLKTFTNAVGRVEHEIITLLVHVQTQWNMYLCKLYGT